MSSERLRQKIEEYAPSYAPGASLAVESLGRALLADWRFVLDLYSPNQASLVADILPEPEAEVWGVLYQLDRQLVIRDDGERSVLDRIEGHRTKQDPENYSPIWIRVGTNSEFEKALTYVGTEEARKRCATLHSDATVIEPYAEAVMRGATEADLPSEYLSFLKELF